MTVAKITMQEWPVRMGMGNKSDASTCIWCI